MFRASILASAALALTLTLVTGCDKPASEQQKANAAQAEANTKITSANMEANDKANAAQAEADKKIAAAESDFSKRREDYRHKVKSDLIELDKKVEQLEAKAKTAAGKSKADLDQRLTQIRTSRAAFDTEMKSVDTASALEWDGTKARVDKTWTDLKALVDKVD